MHFFEEEASLIHSFRDPTLYFRACGLPQLLPFCFSIRVPEFSHGDIKLWPDSDSEVWYQHRSPQLPPLHRVQNKVVEGRWAAPSCSYNRSFANDWDATPHDEANAISAIEIDHINEFSRLAHNSFV